MQPKVVGSLTIALSLLLGACIGLCLGALGGGGSIITVPALVFLLHQPVADAVSQSLIIVAVSSVVAMVAHARAGHVRWRAGVGLGVIGGGAAVLGTMLSRPVPASAILGAFAVLMILVAVSMVARTRSPKAATRARQPLSVASSGAVVEETRLGSTVDASAPTGAAALIRVVLAGVGIGLLTGFFGVGGGFVIVPALVLFLAFPMPVAVGTSLVVIALNSVVALGVRIGDGSPDWAIVLPVTAAAILTSVLGKGVTQRFSESALTRTFAAMLVVVAGYVAIHSLGLITP